MKQVLHLIVLVLLTSSCTPFSDVSKESELAQYYEVVKEKKAVGLDVRSKQEFAKNGSQQAINIPISQLSDRIIEVDKNKTVLVFCESGGRSLMAKKMLQMKGFKKVINIKDWRAWNKIIEAGN